MLPILITVVVVLGVLGVVYLLGSQPSADRTKKTSTRGATMSKSARAKVPRLQVDRALHAPGRVERMSGAGEERHPHASLR